MKLLWIFLAVAGAAVAQDINNVVPLQGPQPYTRANWPFNFQFPNFHFPNVLQPLTNLPIFSWLTPTTPKPVPAPPSAPPPPPSPPPPPQLAPPLRDDRATIAVLINAVNGLQEVVARLQSRQQILLSILRCSNLSVNNCSRDFVSSQELKVPLEPGLGSDLSWLIDGLPPAHAAAAGATFNLLDSVQTAVPQSLAAVPNYLNSGLQNLGSYFGNVLPKPQQSNVLDPGFQNVPNFLNNGYQNQQGYPIRYPTSSYVNYPSFTAGVNGNVPPNNPNIFGLQGNLFPGGGLSGTSNFLQGGGSLFPSGLTNSVSSGSGLPGATNFLQGAGTLFPNGGLPISGSSSSSSSSSSGDGNTIFTSTQQVSDNGSGKPSFSTISSTNDRSGTVIVSTSSEDGGKPHVTKLERDASVEAQ